MNSVTRESDIGFDRPRALAPVVERPKRWLLRAHEAAMLERVAPRVAVDGLVATALGYDARHEAENALLQRQECARAAPRDPARAAALWRQAAEHMRHPGARVSFAGSRHSCLIITSGLHVTRIPL